MTGRGKQCGDRISGDTSPKRPALSPMANQYGDLLLYMATRIYSLDYHEQYPYGDLLSRPRDVFL